MRVGESRFTGRRAGAILAAMFLSALGSAAIVGCAGQQGFGEIGGQILSSTGLMSASQARSLLDAGSKVAEAADVDSLSEEEEYYVGRGVSAMILSRYQPYRNAVVQAYVAKVGRALAAFSDRPETFGGYHFLVLDTPEINAISAPGGFVFVTTGLLKEMPNEEALAAVLAHEIGHVSFKHGLGAISQANLGEALMILGKEAASSHGSAELQQLQQLTDAFSGGVSDIFETLMSKGYSRSQEYESDQYAANLLQRAGYNGTGLRLMLSKLDAASGEASGGLFSTHPAPSDRLEELGESGAGEGAESGEAARTRRFAQAMRGLS